MMPNYRRRCLKPPTLRAALGSRLLIASRRRDFPITAYFSYHLKRYSNWHVDRSDLRPKAIIGYRHVNESWVLIFESVRIDANQVSEYGLPSMNIVVFLAYPDEKTSSEKSEFN